MNLGSVIFKGPPIRFAIANPEKRECVNQDIFLQRQKKDQGEHSEPGLRNGQLQTLRADYNYEIPKCNILPPV